MGKKGTDWMKDSLVDKLVIFGAANAFMTPADVELVVEVVFVVRANVEDDTQCICWVDTCNKTDTTSAL